MAIRKSSTSGVPFGNTANRPANPTVGQTYYNGELGYQEIYTNAGWIPAAGGNDFNLNITGTYTTVTFSQSFAGGSYSIVSSGNDATVDIYAYAGDGSLAGYTATKAFTATQRFNKMVVIGGTVGDVLSFSYKTTFATSATTSETAAGPFITSISPSAMPNVNDTITITGGNFANDVQVAFTGSGYSSTQAKNIVRSSASSLIVTRPDNFPISASPYTITITNPGVSAPAATLANISSNSVTAGTTPVWNTSSTLPTFTRNVSYSTVLSATDPDTGGSVTYSLVSGSLPTGLTLSSLTGGISGTPTSSTPVTFTIRATDAGGNYVDRAFTMPNAAPTWVTTSPITSGFTFDPYSFQLSATDDSGNTPSYSLVSGSLPSGLTLSSSGLISGTASSMTTSSFTVRATDLNNATTDRTFSLTISGYAITSLPSTEGQLILNGYGFESWSTTFGNNESTQFSFTVPQNVTKIRAIAIGGGGGSSGDQNVESAGGGSGVEAFITVTPGETLTCRVGRGGTGVSGGSAGRGGTSSILRGATTLIYADGGFATQEENSRAGYGFPGSGVTQISAGQGGRPGPQGVAGSNIDALSVSVNLSGATAHAGGAGGWEDIASSSGRGLGFGGGGGIAGSTASNSTRRPGGTYGYSGGWGTSGGQGPGLGPVGGWGNSSNNQGTSGGGGGSFGGGSCDGWNGGLGAGGLIRIWWASSAGSKSWIDAGGNYV